MDKNIEIPAFSHIIKINDRKNITLTGVKKIKDFTDKEFSLETLLGTLLIKGQNLEIIKLDTTEGNISIKGKIDSLIYSDNNIKEESFLTKLFKWSNY